MDDALENRIEALERAITDGEHDLSALVTDADAAERLTAVESRLDELDDRVTELEAATQALRGYVGNIRSVNRDVEKRADAALAKVESLESSVTTTRETSEGPADQTDRTRTPADETGRAGHWTGEAENSTEECCRTCGQPTTTSPTNIFPADGVTRADGGNVSPERGPGGSEGVYEPARQTGQSAEPSAHETGTSDGGTLHRIRNLL